MFNFKKIKNIKSKGVGDIYSIQNNETDLYKDKPNYLVEDGIISKNSKHACIHKDSNVLTNSGYKKISELIKTDKIAFIDEDCNIKVTKKYNLIKTGKKKLFKIKTSSGKEMITTGDHELFPKINETERSIRTILISEASGITTSFFSFKAR